MIFEFFNDDQKSSILQLKTLNFRKEMNKQANATSSFNGETIQIGNHCIQFPYVPYNCQRDFMAKVIEALDGTTNAALESPTGTGKTLSLLCAAIAWVKSQKEIRSQQSKQNTPDGQNNSQDAPLPPPQSIPKIYYASRTHSQLQQVIRELNKTAYKSAVRVATLAGRDQLCLNEEVLKEQNKELRGHMCRSLTKNKTCEFHSNMNEVDPDRLDQMYFKKSRGVAMDIEDLVKFAQQHRHCPFYRSRHMSKGADLILLPYNYLLDPEVRKIYAINLKGSILIFDEAHNMESMAEESASVDFSTRTLANAINETKAVIEMIGGDQQMEIMQNGDDENSRFSTLSDDGQQQCRRIKKEPTVKNDEEEDVEDIEMDHEEEEMGEEDDGGEPNRPKMGKLKQLLVKLQSLEKQINRLNLQTDGHPLGKQAEKRVLQKIGEPTAQRVFPGIKMFELLKAAGIHRAHRDTISALVDDICMFLANRPHPNQYWYVRGAALSEFSKMITRVFVPTFGDDQLANPEKTTKQQKRKSTEEKRAEEEAKDAEACRHFKLFVEERWIAVDSPTTKWNHRRPAMSGGLANSSTFGIGNGGHWLNTYDEGAAALEGMDQKEIQLHFWCFDASVTIRYLRSRGPRSIIFASGTLAPLDTFLNSMGLEFGAILESAHCAREEQLVVGALEKGPDKVQLLGTFQKRDDLDYKRAIGVLILQVARVTPQGMLVFFPSYSQMANFARYWQAMRIGKAEGEQLFWPLLERQKQIFTEPQNTSDIIKFFREYDLSVRDNPNGALLFAVCRGKLSEGIDFADSHCRSVVIVGIPFPPLYDPRIMLKKEHLTEQFNQMRLEQSKAASTANKENTAKMKAENGGKTTCKTTMTAQSADDWYKIEGTRAVNQALGRIIRHKDDFGAVILADTRFGTMNRRMFPSWMRASIKVHPTPNSLIPSIQRFFASRGMKKPPLQPIPVEQSRKRRSVGEEGGGYDHKQYSATSSFASGGHKHKPGIWLPIKFDENKTPANAFQSPLPNSPAIYQRRPN